MDFKQILSAIPEVKKEDILSERVLIEDIEKIHHTLTLDNPLTYIIYMNYNKNLSTEERNDIYRIIDRLNKNNKNAFEASIEKQGMKPVTSEEDCDSLQFELSDCEEDEKLVKKSINKYD